MLKHRDYRFRRWTLLSVVAASLFTQAKAIDLLAEDFEGIPLLPTVTVESEIRGRAVWQDITGAQNAGLLAGWTEVNLTTVNPLEPDLQVEEFAGWRFVDKDWWVLTAGGQERNEFFNGAGIVAVADPDEWDDFGDPDGSDTDGDADGASEDGDGGLDPTDGLFDAKLVTPSISLSGVNPNEAKMFFHSSWRPEDDQFAELTAVYDRGTGNETIVPIDRWTSDADDADFKDDATNESLTYDLQNPSGASSVEIEFRLVGNNDWWWAIDNLSVFTGAAPATDSVLRAIIDRDTGEVKIVNNTGAAVDLRGYSLRSEDGAFDEAGVAASGNFLSDSDSDWLQATIVGGEVNDLSEVHVDSDSLHASGEINFGLDAWLKHFRDEGDISFSYLVDGNDDQIPGIVEFIGGDPFEVLDLNFDHAIDILDWETFKTGFGTSLDGLTLAVSHAKGDLDLDGVHTLNDFLEFEVLYNAANGAGAFAAMLNSSAVPEPGSLVLLAVSAIGLLVVSRRRLPRGTVLGVAVVAGMCSMQTTHAQLTLLFEDFEDVVLGDSIDEQVEASNVWSDTPPVAVIPTTGGGTGSWIIDDSGVPVSGELDEKGNPDMDGVTEWVGWATADKEWWIETAEDQDRSQFTRGSGKVFVADPDEWDDAPTDPGPAPFNFYDAVARTPVISIPAGIPAGRIQLAFDSSWKPEGGDDDVVGSRNNQSAFVRATYDGGSAIDVLISPDGGTHWDSDDEDIFFKPDATNERVVLDLEYDGLATTLQLEFALERAWNDWWWAIDNVLVSVPTDPMLLRINTANGQAFVAGDDVIDTNFKSINVVSEGGQLVVNNSGLSSSLSDIADGPDLGDTAGDSQGEHWEMLTSSANQFAEAFLFGSSALDRSSSASLGQLQSGLDADPLVAAANSDVMFTYSLASGDIVTGVVEYFFEEVQGVPGDFNNDGVVNTADYTVWRDNLGGTFDLNGNGNETGGSAGVVDSADYTLWKQNFGNSTGALQAVTHSNAAVPEPATAALVLLAAIGASLGRLRTKLVRLVFVLVAGMAATSATVAHAQLPPSPFVDRLYLFGDDDVGGIDGQPVSQMDGSGNLVTFDSEGSTGVNQLIDLIAESPSSRKATYVSTADRPDGNGGIGIRLNQLSFDRQYLRTGFGEALNFPEQSPSSKATLVNQINPLTDGYNYFRINDRGFELWAKPAAITGEHHIVMDSQQHGVLIRDGVFHMRYGSTFAQETTQLPGPDMILGTEDDELFPGTVDPGPDMQLGTEDDEKTETPPVVTEADYATDVPAVANEWYHLSVVRPFGPGQGSIFYIDGVAEAVGFGEYAVETIVNVGEGEVFTNIDSLDTSPLTIGRATTVNPSFATELRKEFFYQGVVDDLKMFVMGLNDNDNLPGGGTNVVNDWGEYIFQRDNGYAQSFALYEDQFGELQEVSSPLTEGDLNGDGAVTLADATRFAENWLFEKRLIAVDPFTEEERDRLVGDLETRAYGDFDYNGIVDLSDWAILNNANPAAGAAALTLINGGTIPEPSTVVLLVLGTAAGWYFLPRHKGAEGRVD